MTAKIAGKLQLQRVCLGVPFDMGFDLAFVIQFGFERSAIMKKIKSSRYWAKLWSDMAMADIELDMESI